MPQGGQSEACESQDSGSRLCAATLRVAARPGHEKTYTARTRTFIPSRGFGIGHICQSGL